MVNFFTQPYSPASQALGVIDIVCLFLVLENYLLLISFLILTTLPVRTGLDALTASIVVPATPFFIQQLFRCLLSEELHLEYYDSKYNWEMCKQIDAVELLAQQWENWLIQWKPLNASTKASLLAAFKTMGTQAAPAFGMGGQPTSGFGLSSFPVSSSSTSASSFSFKTSSSLTSSTSCGSSLAADGRSAAAANPPTFGTTSSPSAPQSVGFGSPAAPSAASFSFKAAATAGGFGTSGFLGFGSASAGNSASTTPAAFGAFGATVATSASPSSSALSGQSAGASGHPVTSASAAATNSSPASEKLFTPKSELSAEEWQQFEAKEFTIGKIPLKPPPLELLNAFDLLSLF
ncbi:nucleoporin NUP42-like [Taeniopygia guttata]|uniref:nucleoporin NUP42-like n=1 Tax=Taeniopygia guttata TaxID=59729 RepID=UPI003BB99F1A